MLLLFLNLAFAGNEDFFNSAPVTAEDISSMFDSKDYKPICNKDLAVEANYVECKKELSKLMKPLFQDNVNGKSRSKNAPE